MAGQQSDFTGDDAKLRSAGSAPRLVPVDRGESLRGAFLDIGDRAAKIDLDQTGLGVENQDFAALAGAERALDRPRYLEKRPAGDASRADEGGKGEVGKIGQE